ncbi:hypothetical protein HYT52_03910 [Candidatus Woesearchaeota archaeon]|nr:hypothetical protein [Candidatus Woesearchaeota archaeon]
MENGLLLFLLVIGNLTLYWVLYGQKKFQRQLEPSEHQEEKISINKKN